MKTGHLVEKQIKPDMCTYGCHSRPFPRGTIPAHRDRIWRAGLAPAAADHWRLTTTATE